VYAVIVRGANVNVTSVITAGDVAETHHCLSIAAAAAAD